jgi:hypothetical protein
MKPEKLTPEDFEEIARHTFATIEDAAISRRLINHIAAIEDEHRQKVRKVQERLGEYSTSEKVYAFEVEEWIEQEFADLLEEGEGK